MGWYSDRLKVLNLTLDGGFGGSLVGINDYQNSGTWGSHVHLRLLGGTEDLYVGFNRVAGINAGTREAGNQVEVVGQSGPGKPSNLHAKLGSNGEYRVTNFAGGVQDLIIQVGTIDLSSTAVIAPVLTYLDGCPPGACGGACISCASMPTQAPITPTAAHSDPPTTVAPIDSPTIRAPTGSPTTVAPTDSPTIRAPIGSPTIVAPTDSPTTTAPTASPTTVAPTDSPTTRGKPIAGICIEEAIAIVFFHFFIIFPTFRFKKLQISS